jgi:DNA-directed RNA polymerase specialized sigma subunit
MRTLIEDQLNFKLTKEQQKLVIENANVIGAVFHKFVRKYNSTERYDEIYGDAAIGLCRAAKIFNETYNNQGSFFSFAFDFVQWAVFNSNRKRNTYYHHNASLNAIIGNDDHGDDVELGEQIPAPDEWEQLEYKILAESAYQKVEPVLTIKEKEVFWPWLHGVAYPQIAKATGVKEHTVRTRMVTAKNKCRIFFNPEEIFS